MGEFKLDRRGFLQGTAAVAGALTFGIGTAPAIAQSREINMIGWSNPKLAELFARAEKEIGIKINYDVLPAKWDDVMQKVTLWGQTGYDGLDVMFADDLIGGMWGMNGWAEDLSGLSINTDDLVDNIKALNQAAGGVYRLFFTLGAEPFMYNKDLVATPPTTWEEMVATARSITKGDVWGWRPLGGNGHAFNTVLLMLNQAGADLESLSDPATLTALQYMADWVQKDKITPSSTVSEDNAAVEAIAAAGNAGMWWTYDGGTTGILGIEGSKITKDNLGMARWPKGPSSDIGLVHGWGYLQPKASKKKDEGKAVLEWLGQTSIIKEVDLIANATPPYKSLFSDPDYVAAMPQLTAGVGWEELIRGAKFREPIVNHRQVTQIWVMMEKLGGYVLSGEKSPADAQSWAMSEYQTIKDEA
ncbi:MAG TPA: extracellular solute-binding protein [Edaphobacter sp.]|nr:extracellular solute-binding protein [Edaphobacter sp.]